MFISLCFLGLCPTFRKYGLCRSRHFLSLDYLDKITHFLSTINFIAAWSMICCYCVVVSSLSPASEKVLPFCWPCVWFGFLPCVGHCDKRPCLALCVGRVSVGLAVFWFGRGRSLLAQNLVRWHESTLLPGAAHFFKELWLKTFRPCTVTFRKYGSQPPTCRKVFSATYVSFSNLFSRWPLTGCEPWFAVTQRNFCLIWLF